MGLKNRVGPPNGCADALRKRSIDMGFDEIVVSVDTSSEKPYGVFMEGIQIFAEEVMPKLK